MRAREWARMFMHHAGKVCVGGSGWLVGWLGVVVGW